MRRSGIASGACLSEVLVRSPRLLACPQSFLPTTKMARFSATSEPSNNVLITLCTELISTYFNAEFIYDLPMICLFNLFYFTNKVIKYAVYCYFKTLTITQLNVLFNFDIYSICFIYI